MRFAVLILILMLISVVAPAQRQRTPARPKPPAQSQRPEPTTPSQTDDVEVGDDAVRLGADIVNVLFSAVDRNNRVLSDIRQEDIAVLEDGKQQQIFTFKREATLPLNIAILIDLSGSQEYTFPQQRNAANEFLRSVIRPGKDSAAILTFQDDVDLVQGLTSRIETLGRAFDEIQYSRRFGTARVRRQATALYDAIYITADEVLARDRSQSFTSDDSITRRAIILLTDGVDNASTRTLDEAVDRAWRAGVIVYAIGIGDRFRFEGIREDVLQRISKDTGGRAYFPRGPEDLLQDFKQIENEMRSQYLVAYSPSNSSRDGSFRRIEVRLNGRSDALVVHRRGYYAPVEDGRK